MRIKAEWLTLLHRIRQREIELIFSKCPARAFRQGLEIGAGDGFQSTLLTKYTANLVCTDYNPERLRRSDTASIKYMVCDAQNIDSHFSPQQFDIVFSSNLLEHLPQPDKALRGIHKVLKNDGITIHYVPSRFWKACHVALYNPNRLITKLERLTEADQPIYHDELGDAKVGHDTMAPFWQHNSRFRVLPHPHGAYDSNIEEFCAYRRSRWEAEFVKAGFSIVRVVEGPVVSGYGFGLERLRNLLERVGLSSEYAYIAIKAGRDSPYSEYFL